MGQQREQSLAAYYANPNYCICCGNVIKVRDNQKPFNTRKMKFCSQSCSSKYSNAHRKLPKRAYGQCICKGCGATIKVYERSKEGKFLYPKLCSLCKTDSTAKLTENRTLDDLFGNRKNWQSARTAIRVHANRVFSESSKEQVCQVCGYDKHIEICHITAVSKFTKDTLVSVVNNINNLIALCPNHHWEFDNEVLSLSEILEFAKMRL